ncbi:MAG: rubredoxin [Nitrospiraceae bacterium]|nr:rubredoxin [Nitrospiraceae bacterium]
MDIPVEKIPGGFRVDGLELKGGKCGCTSVLPCCHSWSKLKRNGNVLIHASKASTPQTRDHFSWGYTVRKGDFVVEVTMEDARDKSIFSGYYPPDLEDWKARGWEVVSETGAREDYGLWRCAACKWLYKEAVEKVKFEALPAEWRCAVCKAGKNVFERVG